MDNFGSIQTVLEQRNPSISTMTITLDSSMEGLTIYCFDVDDGDRKNCSLQVISK